MIQHWLRREEGVWWTYLGTHVHPRWWRVPRVCLGRRTDTPRTLLPSCYADSDRLASPPSPGPYSVHTRWRGRYTYTWNKRSSCYTLAGVAVTLRPETRRQVVTYSLAWPLHLHLKQDVKLLHTRWRGHYTYTWNMTSSCYILAGVAVIYTWNKTSSCYTLAGVAVTLTPETWHQVVTYSLAWPLHLHLKQDVKLLHTRWHGHYTYT